MDELMPGPEAPTHDPLAVAVGNGSLLGVGYFMLGRRGTAAATGVITLGLVVVLAATRSGWMELVLVGWWAVLIVHGWLLARPGSRVRRQLWIAFSVAIPVLLVVGLLRWDAAGIDADLSEARDQGDCGAARKAVDRVWFGHRLTDAPMTVRTDATAAACDRLETAESDLDNALLPDDGGSFSLAQGFHQLERVPRPATGRERVRHGLDRRRDPRATGSRQHAGPCRGGRARGRAGRADRVRSPAHEDPGVR